jgi:hypothetical protein
LALGTSHFSSRPTNREKIAIKPSLIHSSKPTEDSIRRKLVSALTGMKAVPGFDLKTLYGSD